MKVLPITQRFKNFISASLLVFGLLFTTVTAPLQVGAAITSPLPTAKISFTFDDGFASAITQAAPTLAKYGLRGTSYVTTGCVGMTTVPNKCRANNDASYMTWSQITSLQNTYGWEIGSHSVTHPYLATKDATDGQPQKLTSTQVTQELTKSKSDLLAHGINATDFAAPYGDYDNATLAQIAKLYASHRGFFDQNNNVWAYNDYLLNNMPVHEGVTVAQVKTRIDQAIVNKHWLILTMHDIKVTPSTSPDDYEYSTSKLDEIAAYVKQKQSAGLLQSSRINQGLVTSDSNMLANASFNNGIAGGWRTDSPATITKDSSNNGSYPDPLNAVKLVSSAKSSHLFSPLVAVDPNTTYMLKNFLNVQKITSGEVGFYIDEYDGVGNWISGQYKAAEKNAFVENINFPYKPSSATVGKASLQVIVAANSGITAYLDNSQWFPLSTVTPPARTNLIANGSFDAGISNGWTTDNSTAMRLDTANHGSPENPQNSIRMSAATLNSHLFSPLFTVEAAATYSLSSYLNIEQRTSGEVAYYIDEYDTNGNWISGQYKLAVQTVGAGNVNFQYKSTSTNVKSAKLQLILVGNSNILAYLDNVKVIKLN